MAVCYGEGLEGEGCSAETAPLGVSQATAEWTDAGTGEIEGVSVNLQTATDLLKVEALDLKKRAKFGAVFDCDALEGAGMDTRLGFEDYVDTLRSALNSDAASEMTTKVVVADDSGVVWIVAEKFGRRTFQYRLKLPSVDLSASDTLRLELDDARLQLAAARNEIDELTERCETLELKASTRELADRRLADAKALSDARIAQKSQLIGELTERCEALELEVTKAKDALKEEASARALAVKRLADAMSDVRNMKLEMEALRAEKTSTTGADFVEDRKEVEETEEVTAAESELKQMATAKASVKTSETGVDFVEDSKEETEDALAEMHSEPRRAAETKKKLTLEQIYTMCLNGESKALADAFATHRIDIDIDAKYKGFTCLFITAEMGHTPVVSLLIENGANPNIAATEIGSTPLIVASFYGHIEVVRALLGAKADVNKVTNEGATALFCAAQKGRTEVVRELIRAKADVNKAIDSGDTPLIIAASEGHTAVVSLLLESGADVDIKNGGGKDALYWARIKKHGEIESLLVAFKKYSLSSAK